MAFKDIWETMTGESIEEPGSFSDRLSGELYRLIRMGFGLCGRHFRAMEKVLRVIYKIAVSSEAHDIARSKEHLILCHHFECADSECVDLTQPETRHNLMGALWAAMADIPWDHDKDIFMRALDLFLRLLVNPTLNICEEDGGCLDLENRGIVAPLDCLSILSDDGDEFRVYVDGNIHCKHPKRLQDILPMLVSNIGQAATSVFDDAATALEAIVPWAELVRMYAISRWSAKASPDDDQYLPSFDEVLPGAVYCPWEESEVLSSSAWVLTVPFRVNMQLNIPQKERRVMESMEVTNRMIHEAKTSFAANPHAVMGHPREAVTQTIEYVAHHFERQAKDGERTPVLLLASMNLLEAGAVKPELELERIHNVARNTGLRDGEYVAAVYCCADAAICQTAALSAPPGSLIVGAECLKELLAPFGLSYLVQLVGETSQKVQSASSCSAAAGKG
eukprot:gene8011-5766_t